MLSDMIKCNRCAARRRVIVKRKIEQRKEFEALCNGIRTGKVIRLFSRDYITGLHYPDGRHPQANTI